MEKIFFSTSIVALIRESKAPNLTSGDISLSAKEIEAEEFFAFFDAAARIGKVNAWAIIDSAGRFIVHYHKYILHDAHAHFIKAKDSLTGKFAILNSKGEVIVPMGVANEFTHAEIITFQIIQFFLLRFSLSCIRPFGQKNINFPTIKAIMLTAI